MAKLSTLACLYIQRIEEKTEQSWEDEQALAKIQVLNAPPRRCLLIYLFFFL